VYWSVARSRELAIKVGLGKLRLDGSVERVIPAELLRNGFRLLPMEHPHVLAVATLPPIHGDPFDRLLIAQAQAEGLTLVSADAKVTAYGVPILW
jgi:PIN domain nuclease of toxin-antitoxin system